nr:MAG TPA: hypothetical protein [Caudoviricetes sp.]
MTKFVLCYKITITKRESDLLKNLFLKPSFLRKREQKSSRFFVIFYLQ